MPAKAPIDTERLSASLRRKGIELESRRILITRFEGSKQAEDLTLPPNCDGWGRIHHFRRSQGVGWPSNPLPIDPARHALGLPEADTIQVQVFQNAICSWRCWYCFVDYDLLSANPNHSAFKTVDELIDLYLSEPTRSPIIDLSGGQPDLVPEWGLWFADALRERGLDQDVYLWSDDNLSNDYLWRYLTFDEIQRLASRPNYGRVGCFKGFDEHSFAFNTAAAPDLFEVQFRLMSRLVKSGFDVYGYTTFTSDDDTGLQSKMAAFVDRLQSEIHPLFPLRTVPLRISEFTPTAGRMQSEHRRSLEVQNQAVDAWAEELARRFPVEIRQRRVFDHRLDS
jgi:uncharacterized Fe-S cluster-containing radical SAM superfamily protein